MKQNKKSMIDISGVLESLVAHQDGLLDQRMLKLVRMSVSFAVACPFCIDMNSYEYQADGILDAEVLALHGIIELESVPSFSVREGLAIQYARLISQTPLKFYPDFIEQIKANFTEREMVILASTAHRSIIGHGSFKRWAFLRQDLAGNNFTIFLRNFF